MQRLLHERAAKSHRYRVDVMRNDLGMSEKANPAAIICGCALGYVILLVMRASRKKGTPE